MSVESAAQMVYSARTGAGLSQAELARRAHTSRPAIARYESGSTEPTLPVLRRILQAAGADVKFVPNPDQGRRVAEVCELADAIVRSRSGSFPFDDSPDWPVFKNIAKQNA